MRLLTVDASVFVSAARPDEPGNAESTMFLGWVRAHSPRLFLPTLTLVETSASLSRTGSDSRLAHEYALAISRLPATMLVALDEALALRAAALGAEHGLRGADAVYLATAALCAADLVTLDQEQLVRGAPIVRTLTPSGFLATIQ